MRSMRLNSEAANYYMQSLSAGSLNAYHLAIAN
jgi:hypothetical protein